MSRTATSRGRAQASKVEIVDPFSVVASTRQDPPLYCHGHQVCQADGCESLVFHDISHRPARYCFRHFCAASATCEGQRVEGEGAQACRDHSCALYSACSKPRVDITWGLFCEDHECADPPCRKQTYNGGGDTGSTWCADHMCMAALLRQADCANRREGTVMNPLYCPDHGPCAHHAHSGLHPYNRCRCRGAGSRGRGFCMCQGDGNDDGGDDDDDSVTSHGDECGRGSSNIEIEGCVCNYSNGKR
ncbi:hypothetical protein F5Y11DRAFT_350384 [Daldinia sp. FL1419]|nr:hypothetical protein F5Y11DRAFT_350384 [Daldinia sp. FL1419]